VGFAYRKHRLGS